jgi:hypothetical protein
VALLYQLLLPHAVFAVDLFVFQTHLGFIERWVLLVCLGVEHLEISVVLGRKDQVLGTFYRTHLSGVAARDVVGI